MKALDALNAKISALPPADRVEALYLRDERLGCLCGAAEPAAEDVAIVHEQLFPADAQQTLLLENE